MTRFVRLALLFAVAVSMHACAPAPPNLSPSGKAAFNARRVVVALDVLRDTAIAGNQQIPPLISTKTTRQVVTYHRSAVATIGAVPAGWAPTVTAGLDQLVADLAPPERTQLAPYVALVKTLITEVTR